MTLDDLRTAAEADEIDTVVLAITDMQGRLQGKRFTVSHFLNAVVEAGAEACNYLLAVDVDMNTVGGYRMSSWETGYGDFLMVPDLTTLRRVPWLPKTALLLADLAWHDHSPVPASPRQILIRQLERLRERGWTALAATELEFLLFETSYRDAFKQGYRDMDHANLYNVDYSILGTSHVEPLIRRIRNEMLGAGLVVENSKGECNFGQHEVELPLRRGARRPRTSTRSTRTAPRRSPTRRGWRSPSWRSTTSARAARATCTCRCATRRTRRCSPTSPRSSTPSWPASWRRCASSPSSWRRTSTPTSASRRRRSPRPRWPGAPTTAPARSACSATARASGSRTAFPARDVNPYLGPGGDDRRRACTAIDAGLELEPELAGNAYASGKQRVPGTLRDARDLFAASDVAREAFGEDVVEHYCNNAAIELAAFDATVTEWERFRGFERL